MDISIELGEGELVGLLGVSGVGKSTLFSVLSGLLVPKSGHVLLRGTHITGRPAGQLHAAKGFAFALQNHYRQCVSAAFVAKHGQKGGWLVRRFKIAGTVQA